MPYKDPSNWPLTTWLLALGMAFSGGLVNWYAKVKAGHTRAFNLIELIGEVFISGFVGVAVFMLFSGLGYNEAVSAAATGIAGHMATRLLFLVELAIESKFYMSMRAEVAGRKKKVDDHE